MPTGSTNSFKPAVLVVWLLILGALIGLWFMVAPQQEKLPETPKHPVPPKSAPEVVAPSVATPASPSNSSVLQPETPNPKLETASVVAANPQADLSTALPDIVGLLQSGELLTAYQRYMPPSYFASMPPPVIAQLPAQMQRMQSDPNTRQHVQFMAQAFQAMQTQTPALNAAGDKATYTYPDPNGKPTPFIFQKIDGQWYVSPEMGTFF